MRTKEKDPQVLELRDLEQARFRAGMIAAIGVLILLFGLGLLLETSSHALDQVDELSDRVDRLNERSTSEQPKT